MDHSVHSSYLHGQGSTTRVCQIICVIINSAHALYIQLYSPIYMVAEIRKTTERKERKKPCYCTND